MEQMLEFDRRLKETDSYRFLMSKFVTCIFTVLGSMMTLLPVEKETGSVLFFSFWMLGMAVTFHMTPYLYVNQNGKNISVYGVLKQTPVERKVYIKARRKRLVAYWRKLGIAALALQTIGTIAGCGFEFKPLLGGAVYVITLFAGLLLAGLGEISWSAK